MSKKNVWYIVASCAIAVTSGCATNGSKPADSKNKSSEEKAYYISSEKLPVESLEQAGFTQEPKFLFKRRFIARMGQKNYDADVMINGKRFRGNIGPEGAFFSTAIIKNNGKFYVAGLQAGGSCDGKKLPLYDKKKYEEISQLPGGRFKSNWDISANGWKFSTVIYEVDISKNSFRDVACWPGEKVPLSSEGGDFMTYMELDKREVSYGRGSPSNKLMKYPTYVFHKVTFSPKGEMVDRIVAKNANYALPVGKGEWLVAKNGVLFKNGVTQTDLYLYRGDGQVKDLLRKDRSGVSKALIDRGYRGLFEAKQTMVEAFKHNFAWRTGLVYYGDRSQSRLYDWKTGKVVFDFSDLKKKYQFSFTKGDSDLWKGKDGHIYMTMWLENDGFGDVAKSLFLTLMTKDAGEGRFPDGHFTVYDITEKKPVLMTEYADPKMSSVSHYYTSKGREVFVPKGELGLNGEYKFRGLDVTDPHNAKRLPRAEMAEWYEDIESRLEYYLH